MGPFEIAAIAIIGGLSLSAFKHYKQVQGNVSHEQVEALKTQIDKLQQRVATLETLVTDKSYQLGDEINKL